MCCFRFVVLGFVEFGFSGVGLMLGIALGGCPIGLWAVGSLGCLVRRGFLLVGVRWRWLVWVVVLLRCRASLRVLVLLALRVRFFVGGFGGGFVA